jgi:hypothetical protein
MKNEIIILCNSAACLKEVSSGNWPDLHTKNIFTCNLAYTHFRTSARHLNIFSDAPLINKFLNSPDWARTYDTYQYTGIEFIFNTWDLGVEKNICPSKHEAVKAICKYSPVIVPASSAIGALFYLSAVENFDKIHLLGYTINEWEGIEHVKELASKQNAFNEVYKKYEVENPREFVYTYSRR